MKTNLQLTIMETGLTIQDIAKIKEVCEQYKGDKIDMTIDKHKHKRSNPQNAYLHGVVIPLVTNGIKDLGNDITQAQTKDMLKQMFLSYDVRIDEGSSVEVQKNTSGLSTIEFAKFVEDVQRWSAEMLGIIVPDPNQELTFEQ